MVVLGASVSSGFLLTPSIASILDEAIEGPHRVHDFAEQRMFEDPFGKGRRAVERALAVGPAKVIAVDFLFWYVYGAYGRTDARLSALDVGLAELSRLPGPVFVGDVPDMRQAAGWMLSPDAVPTADDLAAVNARIRAWAAQAPGRHVLPIAEWSRPLLADGTVVIDGEAVPVESLMSMDGLHPNRAGMLYLLHLIKAEVKNADPDLARLSLPSPTPPTLTPVAMLLVAVVLYDARRAAAKRCPPNQT